MTLKYHNKITEVDGIKFRSKKESRRYGILKLLEKAGEITHLELQKKYVLNVDNIHITNYFADFYYFDVAKNKWITEDTKGMKTALYISKSRLMLACHGIKILET